MTRKFKPLDQQRISSILGSRIVDVDAQNKRLRALLREGVCLLAKTVDGPNPAEENDWLKRVRKELGR